MDNEQEWIRTAVAESAAAAAGGRAWDAVTVLWIPPVIGRVRRKLRSNWSWMGDDQIQDAVVDAYVAMYREIRRGGTIPSPLGWLIGVAWRRAADTMRKFEPEQLTDPREMPDGPEPAPEAAGGGESELTAAAFATFERLVSRLTPDGVRRVMGIVLEACRSGATLLTNAQIAQTLGEHPENVKKWRQRGFKKLARIATDEGLVGENLKLTDLVFDYLDDGDEEES